MEHWKRGFWQHVVLRDVVSLVRSPSRHQWLICLVTLTPSLFFFIHINILIWPWPCVNYEIKALPMRQYKYQPPSCSGCELTSSALLYVSIWHHHWLIFLRKKSILWTNNISVALPRTTLFYVPLWCQSNNMTIFRAGVPTKSRLKTLAGHRY